MRLRAVHATHDSGSLVTTSQFACGPTAGTGGLILAGTVLGSTEEQAASSIAALTKIANERAVPHFVPSPVAMSR
ncbi:hypothetical protein [Lentzea sp. NPDC004782]|uniref:hypothetical protein n=1 Tax=Lentzea sp. NPDC004782 TaxID=3154458 RepID=UPI0033B6C711